MFLLTSFYIVGITFILLSLYLSYWRGKRKFNRRNAFGREEFSSYEKSLMNGWTENFASFLSILLMILGIILLLFAYFDSKDIMRVTHW
ncbi:MAG: hypothetical protein JST19_11640 [Bacteroidetes bacterium]|nr:hypothetical protein [Bacteroidota bacterium]